MISGLMTKVGRDVTGFLPMVFVAVVTTTMYLPSSAIVGVKLAAVAPEIVVQLVKSAGSSQTFH
jgi:hypothetical protein